MVLMNDEFEKENERGVIRLSQTQ